MTDELVGPDLRRVLSRVQGPQRAAVLELVGRARLDVPAAVTIEAAETAVRPYAWLLERVGDDGVKLTAAGYLPPAVVVEAMTVLGDRVDWIGKGNREDLTIPVLDLRESAQQLKLVRKYRGRLVLSPAGRRLRADPVALWRYLAQSLPGSPNQVEGDAGTLLLLRVAAGEPDSWNDSGDFVAQSLAAMGWQSGYSGAPPDRSLSQSALWPTRSMLRRLGYLISRWFADVAEQPSPEAAQFARAALQVPVEEVLRPRANVGGPGRGRRRSVALPDLDLARIKRWCEGRVPLSAQDQVRLEFEVAGMSVTIVERRAPWPDDPDPQWTRLPVARLQFSSSTQTWSLRWRDRYERYHAYERLPASPTVQTLLDEIDRDPNAIFWG